MAKPPKNGVAQSKVQTPRDAKPLVRERMPIGRAPKDFDPKEREMWNTIVKECPWVDSTHRQWVRGYASAAARVDDINKYFRARRANFAERGHDVALAYLDDEGKRHPLMAELMTNEESLRKALSQMGANPAAQVRMMSDFGTAKKTAQEDEMRQRYFK